MATDGLKPRVKYAVHIAARYSCDAVAEEAIAETRRRVVKPDACDELTLAAQRWATRARRRRRHPSRPSSRRSCPQHCVCVDRCVEAMDGSACLPPSLPHPRTVTEQGLHWGNAGGQAGTRERERARARGSYDATIGSQCSSTCEHWYACTAPVAGLNRCLQRLVVDGDCASAQGRAKPGSRMRRTPRQGRRQSASGRSRTRWWR